MLCVIETGAWEHCECLHEAVFGHRLHLAEYLLTVASIIMSVRCSVAHMAVIQRVPIEWKTVAFELDLHLVLQDSCILVDCEQHCTTSCLHVHIMAHSYCALKTLTRWWVCFVVFCLCSMCSRFSNLCKICKLTTILNQRKTWWDCVKNDMESLGLSQKDA